VRTFRNCTLVFVALHQYTVRRMAPPILIKKYGNRRLYDTAESRYITLEELADKIQGGTDVRVVAAKTGEDLTQATLTQIIIEGRGVARLLPVPLLTQLIRLGDDALAEFFGRYVSGALELYLQAKRGAQRVAPFNPFATLPFQATNALARMWMGGSFGAEPEEAPPPYRSEPHAPAPYEDQPEPDEEPEPPAATGRAPSQNDEIAELRRELEELKRSVRGDKAPPKSRKRRS